MPEEKIVGLVNALKAGAVYESASGLLRSFSLPRLTWDPSDLETSFDVVLPTDLKMLWNKSAGLVMFWDVTYGQWGLVLWSPDQTRVRHPRRQASRGPRDWRRGDLVIGEFLGDSDLLVIRCDAMATDFGSLLIASAIDPRESWKSPGHSLSEFLSEFWGASGQKFWERNP